MNKLKKVVELISKKQIQPVVKMIMVLVYVFSLISLTFLFQTPPNPKEADTSIQDFSAERAMEHLNHIAAEIHPTGSIENEKVRQYIVDQLNELDMEPKVDTYNGFIETTYFSGDIELNNIIGVLKGTGSGKAIMLSAHYDSVKTAPGANDNGLAVASLLETARALKNGTPIGNDVWLVFTDAEEIGLLGAEVFWNNKEYKDQIGLIANFESRGSKGSSMMFQTSEENGTLIQEFAKASMPNPLANSFMGDLYNKLPNDTDFTISKAAGIPGFNFAYIDGWETYHTPEDNIDNVNLSTFQHHGENALYITKHFGNMDLSNLRSANEVYFNYFGTVIHYPGKYVVPLTALLIILFIVVVAVSIKKEVINLKGISFGFLMILLCILISVVSSVGICFGIYRLWADSMTLFNDYTYNANLYSLSFLLVTMVVNATLFIFFRSKVNEMEMLLNGMFLFLLLLIASVIYLPGASYLLTLPLLVATCIIAFVLTKPDPLLVLNKPITLVLVSFVPITLFATVFQLLIIALDPFTNIVGVVLLSLLIALLHPIHKHIITAPRIFIPIAIIAIVLLVGTGWFNAINPLDERPIYQDENSTKKS